MLDSQIAIKRASRKQSERNRAVFLTVGIMIILIGGAAALMVLAQMLHELPERAPAGASAVAH